MVRSAALSLPQGHALDPSAYFEYDKLNKTDSPGLQGLEDGETPQDGQDPDLDNECVPFTVEVLTDRDNPTFLGTYAEASLPPICEEEGTVCELDFVGFSGGDVPSSDSQLNQEALLDRAQNEILAANPKAKFGCAGPDCVNLVFADSGNGVVAQASASVPLNILFGHAVDLSYSDEETFESHFVK